MRIRPLYLIPALVVCASAGVLVKERTANVQIVRAIVKPEHLEPAEAPLRQLKVPPGFVVNVFAENLGKPRVLAVSDDGRVYVTRREPGDVLVLRDTGGDGKADDVRTAARRPMLHGIALSGRRAYFVTVKDVFAADVQSDGTFANISRIVDDLPEAGQHADRTIRVGPDNFLYVSIGSTCNACDESSPENATIVRISPDGKSRSIIASGLRNTIGFDWHPDTRELFGMDNGIDDLGDDEQPEELNRIVKGKQYGWPYVYGKGTLNPERDPAGEVSAEEWAQLSENPVLTYTAHAAPMQMAFYAGRMFPNEYFGDAFVAMHGSWNRKTPSGYEVVRVRFQHGTPAGVEPFLTGFLTSNAGHPAYVGRPMGVTMAHDGALLVSDDANGRIFRVVYKGPVNTTARREPAAPSPVGTSGTVERGTSDVLAIARSETRASGQLSVTSPAFSAGGAIPLPYSQYGERFSPSLRWSGAPANTKSFVLLLEDPDAKEPKPFVHWVLYNVPAMTTQLPESVPTPLRLAEPKGAMQGRNSRGQVGYMGPRPPAGDPAHHYHFQLFALDTMLMLPPGAERDAVVTAMNGHVLARGEVVGTFQRR